MKATGTELRDRTIMNIMVFASFAAGLYLFATYNSVPLNEDAGFYISISRDVMRGAIPTIGVTSSYTPGIYYTTSLIMTLLGTEYSNILLVMYLVQVANTVLLYFILSRFIRNHMVRLFVCLSYYYSHMLLEGHYFELEPFVILFLLIAVLFYLSAIKPLQKMLLVGFFVGCSIMYKQYALVALMAFCIATWYEYRETVSGPAASVKILQMLTMAALPYLLFVFLTDITFAGSLYSFGYLGFLNASGGIVSMNETLKNVLIRMIHMNWLFIPAVIALYLKYFGKMDFRINPLVWALFGFFLLPPLFRQHGHYYQLISPWAYIIGAAVAEKIIVEEDFTDVFMKKGLISLSLVFFVVLPLFLLFSPSFYAMPAPHARIALTTSVFLFCAVLTVSPGLFPTTGRITVKRIAFILMVLLFFETLFLSLKIPFGFYKQHKSAQQVEAAKVNEVFPRKSEVYVVNYPQIYYLCDLTSPVRSYAFPFTEERAKAVDWSKVDKLAVKGRSHIVSPQMLEKYRYKEVLNIDGSLTLYSRETSR